MFTKIVTVSLLLSMAYARVLLVRNEVSVPLIVSVTDQDDVTVLNHTTVPLTVPDAFSGSISAIRSDTENKNVPRTRVELNLDAIADTYAVSLIDGFNLRAKVVPIQGTNCSAAVCAANLRSAGLCPVENQVVNSLGVIEACTNSPLLFGKVCPKAVVSSEDVTQVLSCQAVSYLIILG
ncbi:hypothetical protein NQ317_015939 [Molorchus minor]|uniref:Uncharacterized protein n=1 Tax=Molorchus minor TaxID=1323400 RepID=A0ABQ9JJF3_9CUCU|nr:hypothetical protein NQ317_015939 [Molorchus minor]